MPEHSVPIHPIRQRLPLLLVLCGAAIGFWLLRDMLSFEALRENRMTLMSYRDSHPALSVVLFVSAYTAIVVFSLPGATVATLTGGFLFSTFPGVLFNIAGATLGATGLFLAARWGLGDRLAARMESSEGKIKKIKDGIDANQWSMLFLLRLVPAVPFFVANLIPAFVGVPLHRYVVSTALGIVPGAIVLTSIGAGLGAVFDQGTMPDLSFVFEPQFLLPVIGLCALALLPVILKLVRGKDLTE